MTYIQVRDLNVSGSVLFAGEEGYLDEINDDELNLTYGGLAPVIITASLVVGFTVSYDFTKATREIHDKNESIISPL